MTDATHLSSGAWLNGIASFAIAYITPIGRLRRGDPARQRATPDADWIGEDQWAAGLAPNSWGERPGRHAGVA